MYTSSGSEAFTPKGFFGSDEAVPVAEDGLPDVVVLFGVLPLPAAHPAASAEPGPTMAAIAAERINICRRETSAGKPWSDTVFLLIDEVRTPEAPAAEGGALVRCAQVLRWLLEWVGRVSDSVGLRWI